MNWVHRIFQTWSLAESVPSELPAPKCKGSLEGLYSPSLRSLSTGAVKFHSSGDIWPQSPPLSLEKGSCQIKISKCNFVSGRGGGLCSVDSQIFEVRHVLQETCRFLKRCGVGGPSISFSHSVIAQHVDPLRIRRGKNREDDTSPEVCLPKK